MGKISGTSTEDIDAPIDEVWAALEDILKAPEWQHGLLSMDALERDDQERPVLIEVENDAKIRKVKGRLRITYESPTSMSWVQEKGDFAGVIGSWELEDLGGTATRATYAVEVDPGRVLGMLARGPIVDVLREQMAGTRAGELKRYVEEA